jgi:hypothetical protein
MIFQKIITSLTVLFALSCSPSTQEKLENWSKEDTNAHALDMDQLARISFHPSYRETEWDSETRTLYIEYGGTSALTFSNSSEYIPLTLLDLARKLYRTYYYGKSRNLDKVRVSLVKPFYIKNENNPDSEIQEFEVFRASIDATTWNQLPSKGKAHPFEVDNNDQPIGNFRKELDHLIQIWKVELNEFARIEVQ